MTAHIKTHLQNIEALLASSELYSFTFNGKDLPDHTSFNSDIRKEAVFAPLFNELNKKTKYCLYWFACDDEDKAAKLNALLDVKREELANQPDGKPWKVPPKGKKINSKVMYVGVRQGGATKEGFSNVAGRMVHHLGYYHVKGTGSLQLSRWASGYDCNITINVMEMDIPEETQYLYILEKLVAIVLKPLCGKH